jgi:hypothetical protein
MSADKDNMKGLIRGAAISMPVGLALLIGGVAAIAGNATTLGAVLIAGAIVSVGTGLVLMLQVRSRARAFSRNMQAEQQANLDAAIRNYRNSQS